MNITFLTNHDQIQTSFSPSGELYIYHTQGNVAKYVYMFGSGQIAHVLKIVQIVWKEYKIRITNSVLKS